MILKRIKEYIEYKGMSVKSFEESIRISNGLFSKMLNSKGSMGSDKLERLFNAYPDLNPTWVMTGEEGMLRNMGQVGETDLSDFSNVYRVAIKPHIPLSGITDSRPDLFLHTVTNPESPHLSLPFFSDYDFSFPATGNSMLNRDEPGRSIENGDLVVCRLLDKEVALLWGEVYAFRLQGKVVIRMIQSSSLEGCVKAIPFNTTEGFQIQDIAVAQVTEWAHVVGMVKIRQW